jgi:hypothetical protein
MDTQADMEKARDFDGTNQVGGGARPVAGSLFPRPCFGEGGGKQIHRFAKILRDVRMTAGEPFLPSS